ncbi:MAG: hypothetical protein AAB520_00120, partial [Patescibacteria group bacterium]
LTHTDSSAWLEADGSKSVSTEVGTTYVSSKQLSNYPMTEVTINEIPQGVFISRRAVGAWDYDPLDAADSSLTPGYQSITGEIGFIEAYCAHI